MTASKDEHEVHQEEIESLQPQTPKLRTSDPDTQLAPLRAYSEIFASYVGEDPSSKKCLIRGYMDLGVSYARDPSGSTPTFLAVLLTKALVKADGASWPQLLCYMGKWQILVMLSNC